MLIGAIEDLFERHGEALYDSERQESVTALEHALQCAQLAEWAQAAPALIAAALLHDVGHLLVLSDPKTMDEIDDAHELRALPFLTQSFGPAVTEPVRLHVAAKRYLVRANERYAQRLSPASVHSLRLQGGPMDDAEARAFSALPYAQDALQLRRWDEAAKVCGRSTPPLFHYLALLAELPASVCRVGS